MRVGNVGMDEGKNCCAGEDSEQLCEFEGDSDANTETGEALSTDRE